MPWMYKNRQVKEGRGWKDDEGVKHPWRWATAWTDKEKRAAGLRWKDEQKNLGEQQDVQN